MTIRDIAKEVTNTAGKTCGENLAAYTANWPVINNGTNPDPDPKTKCDHELSKYLGALKTDGANLNQVLVANPSTNPSFGLTVKRDADSYQADKALYLDTHAIGAEIAKGTGASIPAGTTGYGKLVEALASDIDKADPTKASGVLASVYSLSAEYAAATDNAKKLALAVEIDAKFAADAAAGFTTLKADALKDGTTPAVACTNTMMIGAATGECKDANTLNTFFSAQTAVLGGYAAATGQTSVLFDNLKKGSGGTAGTDAIKALVPAASAVNDPKVLVDTAVFMNKDVKVSTDAEKDAAIKTIADKASFVVDLKAKAVADMVASSIFNHVVTKFYSMKDTSNNSIFKMNTAGTEIEGFKPTANSGRKAEYISYTKSLCKTDNPFDGGTCTKALNKFTEFVLNEDASSKCGINGVTAGDADQCAGYILGDVQLGNAFGLIEELQAAELDLCTPLDA